MRPCVMVATGSVTSRAGGGICGSGTLPLLSASLWGGRGSQFCGPGWLATALCAGDPQVFSTSTNSLVIHVNHVLKSNFFMKFKLRYFYLMFFFKNFIFQNVSFDVPFVCKFMSFEVEFNLL